jgi:hypothetical protein
LPALPFDLEDETEEAFDGYAGDEALGDGLPGLDLPPDAGPDRGIEPSWHEPAEPRVKRLPAATRKLLEGLLQELEDLRALLPESDD